MKKLSIISTLVLILSTGFASAQTTPAPLSDRAAARFLDQATWGPNAASIAQLQQMGIENWLAQQFALNTSDLPDQQILNTQGKSNNNLIPVQVAFFNNAVNQPDQLRQRVAFILSQIWVVSAVQIPQAYAYPPYWRIFRDNAFGNYRDIIKAVTLSPAMGSYLSMANNNKANAAQGTSPNENYARELMQLFTLGLTQLNMDGTPVLDKNGNPVPTYTQTDVTNNAKLLTGWTYPTAPGATPRPNNPPYYVGQMFAVPAEHDTTAKTILGNIHVPAGQSAEADLEALITALMQRSTLAPFISQQLIQHLVTSNPSPAYIQRVAEVFENDANHVTGNMQAVITAILTDPEARAGDDPKATISANFGHLREPILFMANILRGLNATLSSTSRIDTPATNMSQNLFNPPSVFSYFSPQSRGFQGLLTPEFQIYSTQTVANRMDVVNSAVFGAIDRGTKVDLTPFVAQGNNTTTLLNYIAKIFLHSNMSPALTLQATDAMKAATTPTAKAQAALYLTLTSGEYQIVQ